MLTYEPGSSIAHRLDPRSKLAVQIGIALAAFSHTTPRGLSFVTVLTGCILAVAALSPLAALQEIRYALPFLVAGPLLSMIVLRPPWLAPPAAIRPALASYRVLLVLLVSVAYVRTTRVRESRAAIQLVVPGRVGRLLGVGVSLVFRFLPVLIADLSRARVAMRARLGTERRLIDRMRIVATTGVRRAFGRADRLGTALRARCFAWNPTLPTLQLAPRDVPFLLLAVALITWSFV
ncbi:energy-coupling factor transporter transmembrane component T family protein [Halocatena pleomorpha]|uniref:Energy-coupling factor transporter transmembrane protein EcfT n=1 Tax=Halocatena pleomorpha TaxID=1785090 RepID=A0A3P3RDX4_9EURY|nr:energy-coupling factor transporter transmembrane component T [Halocatena pleomorpha]RRJ31544.1 energy-coupling factor transporter transmembrane protein EcfT [Halocatena pleomorpha]